MKWIIISYSRLKITGKSKCVFLVLALLLQGIIAPFLHSSTSYTTSILDKEDYESGFLEAIKSNNVDAVRSLVNFGYDVNEKNKYGYTPLMGAVYSGNVGMVKLFISAGAELEAYDNLGNTPFMYAFYGTEKKSMVEFLLSLNVNIEVMTSHEKTPLILATLNNHCKSMELLIEFGANIEAKGESGSTPLMLAADNQNIESAKLLIKYGANLDTRDDWSFTPLMSAAFRNDGSMIRVLLKAGANVNACTTQPVPISLKKDWRDFFPQTVYVPIGSTALDIAQQFEKRFAENILIKEQNVP